MQFDFAAEGFGEPLECLLCVRLTGWLRRRHCR
jgi:hypothetical protein